MYHIQIIDGIATFSGVDWDGKYIAIRHPGGSAWTGHAIPRRKIKAYTMIFLAKSINKYTQDGVQVTTATAEKVMTF
jgi:hypothetical protein